MDSNGIKDSLRSHETMKRVVKKAICLLKECGLLCGYCGIAHGYNIGNSNMGGRWEIPELNEDLKLGNSSN